MEYIPFSGMYSRTNFFFIKKKNKKKNLTIVRPKVNVEGISPKITYIVPCPCVK